MTTMTWLERDRWSTLPGNGDTEIAAPVVGARYERVGSELALVVPITRTEAANGALVLVPVPGTTVKLRIPPGTSDGHRMRVARPHAPAPDGFGDLTVVVEVR